MTSTSYQLIDGYGVLFERTSQLQWAIDRAAATGCSQVWEEVRRVHGNGDEAFTDYADLPIRRTLVWRSK